MKPRRIKATPEEQARYDKLKQMPCIACRDVSFGWYICGPTEIHHLTSGGRRLGNEFTIPLGSFHHRAQLPKDCKTAKEAVSKYGPSLETSKRDFVARYGTEMELLEKTNKLIGA